MKDASPQKIYLADYKVPNFLVDQVDLTFKLAPTATRVISKIAFRPNPDATDRRFFLHGRELDLKWAKIDGVEAAPDVTQEGLTCNVPNAPFVWEAEVEISPETNTSLDGLYMSNGMYCTQCEAEGFRKITFYPDRPDVMSVFNVRIEGDYPVLLSNGNPTASGAGWAEWHDPWPKPAYLFALVAGNLVNHPDRFTTKSGRDVELNIWVRPGDEHKCAFGMEALKTSMKWDEYVYGREYDLDLFNIVAVDDFNMGAMENKGLNIFNSSAVLASPETSTDANFERIEAIIAHEYFHNWTGNRITCRDWFQLCLKEGLTVFRDSQFTSDLRSAAVKRIEDVIFLRSNQFREDNGPLAHPVRPDSFVEINNFYTLTVYEKGAELIHMLKTLVGDTAYYRALDLYFERHDGQACTIEDWLQVFEDTTGRDLSQFKRWYEQAGTPRLNVREGFTDGTLTLHFKQSTPATPDQPHKDPRVIPIAIGLLDQDGAEIAATQVLEMTEAVQSFSFSGFDKRPVPSVLRGFSAPVYLRQEIDAARQIFLLAHDTDSFNKWEAGDQLMRQTLLDLILKGTSPSAAFVEALRTVAEDDTLDPAFRSLVLSLPTQEDMASALADMGETPDPIAIWNGIETLRKAIASELAPTLERLFDAYQVKDPYQPDFKQSAARALTNRCLGYLSVLDDGARAKEQYKAATNMTQQLAALANILALDSEAPECAAFYEQWKEDRLVMDKWFALQVACARPDQGVAITKRLTEHADFDWKNPNRFRSVLGALSGHAVVFHDPSGEGYGLMADWLITLDPVNAQTTARMCSAFQSWRRYDSVRQEMMKSAIKRILNRDDVSRNTSEILTRLIEGES